MPNKTAKHKKRKKHELNKSLKSLGRTPAQIARKLRKSNLQ